MAMEADGIGLLGNAANYEKADHMSVTNQPGPFISSEKRLAIQNIAVPDPPAWQTFLLATHPPTIERIGTAVAFERGRR